MASTPDAQQVHGGGGGGGGEPMPEGATPPPLSNTHQLDFYQAMGDFRVMFPNMDEEIIEAVLRANKGAVDATIDQLLTMNVDTTPADNSSLPASVASEPPGYATATKKTPASASKWSAQKPVLADSTSSEDEDPPPYPPYQPEDVHDYANTDLLGAAAASNQFFDEPLYAAPKLLESPAAVTMNSHTQKPTDNALKPLNTSSNLFTPAPAFDPFDDPFFTTPAAPKAAPPPARAASVAEKSPQVAESPKKKLYKPRWNPPMLGDLPDDFLRITFEVKKKSSTSSPQPVSVARVHSSRSSHGDDVTRSSSSKRKAKHRHSEEQSPSQHHAHSPSSATLNSDMIAARIAENSRQRSEVKGNPDKAQMLDDEMFALYLQNEEFLNDLREDEDFMQTLERERMNATAFEPSSEDPELDPNRPKRGQLEGYGEDGLGALGPFPYDKDVPQSDQNAELRMQLNHMGGSSKKKLATLARRFFSRTKKKKSSKQMPLGPSKHNLLEEEPDSETGAMASLREDSESNLTMYQYH